jgi:hypothetical protein
MQGSSSLVGFLQMAPRSLCLLTKLRMTKVIMKSKQLLCNVPYSFNGLDDYIPCSLQALSCISVLVFNTLAIKYFKSAFVDHCFFNIYKFTSCELKNGVGVEVLLVFDKYDEAGVAAVYNVAGVITVRD